MGVPRIKFVGKGEASGKKNAVKDLPAQESAAEEEEEESEGESEAASEKLASEVEDEESEEESEEEEEEAVAKVSLSDSRFLKKLIPSLSRLESRPNTIECLLESLKLFYQSIIPISSLPNQMIQIQKRLHLVVQSIQQKN